MPIPKEVLAVARPKNTVVIALNFQRKLTLNQVFSCLTV